MTDAKEGQGTSGWVIFASIMLVVGSLSHFSTGMTFVFNTQWALANTDFTSESDVQILGWISLAIGTLMLVSAWGVLSARTWARVVGIIFGLLTVVNGISTAIGITDLGVGVLWGVPGILVGAAIIYALTAKGKVVAPDQVPMGDEGMSPIQRAGEAEPRDSSR